MKFYWKKTSKIFRVIFLFLFFMCFLWQSFAKKIPEKDVPKLVLDNFSLAYPKMKVLYWEMNGEFYCAYSKLREGKIISCFESNGNWIETKASTLETNLPLKAHHFLEERYAAYNIEYCCYQEKNQQKPCYDVNLYLRNNKAFKTNLLFDLSGNILEIDGVSIANEQDLELKEKEYLADKQTTLPLHEKEEKEGEGEKTHVSDFSKIDTEIETRSEAKQAKEVSPKTRKTKENKPVKAEAIPIDATKTKENKPVKAEAIPIDARKTKENKPVKTEAIPIDARKTKGNRAVEKPVEKRSVAIEKGAKKTKVAEEKKQGEVKEESKELVVPLEPVLNSFLKRFPRAENKEWFKDKENRYRVVFDNYDQHLEAMFFADGLHLYTAYFFDKKTMPYPIQRYLDESPVKYKMEEGKRVVYEAKYKRSFAGGSKPKDFYKIKVSEKIPKQKERKYAILLFDQSAQFDLQMDYNETIDE